MAIAGDPADNTLLASFIGEEFCGTWELRVSDGAGADSGSLNTWCLLPPPNVIPDPPGVPSTTIVGVIVTALLLFGTSTYLRRRRATD